MIRTFDYNIQSILDIDNTPIERGYIYGGYDSGFTKLADCDQYTPVSNAWVSKTDMPAPARLDSAGSAISNKAYTYYGYSSGYVFDTDEYDPVGNSWASKTDGLSERDYVSAFTVLTKAYIIGGEATSNTDEYDAVGNSWATVTSNNAWQFIGATTISSKGYAFGGNTLSSTRDDCDEYDPVGNSWTAKTDMPSPTRAGASASTISDKGYVYGGNNNPGGGTWLQDCDEYDAVGNSWVSKTDLPSPARTNTSASTVLNKGYVYSGISFGSKIADCDEYDSVGNSWANKADLAKARSNGPASSLTV